MKKSNIFWGLIIILFALCFLLSYTDFAPDIPFYKIFITMVLIYTTIKSIFDLNFFGILMSLALLGCLYDDLLKITAITPWPLLITAFLCSIGLNLIFKHGDNIPKNEDFPKEKNINFKDNSQIAVDNNFGSVNKYVNSDNFSHARINNNFGKTNIYFDNAALQSDKAQIYVGNCFGEVNLYLPHTWKVNISKRVSFGDIKLHGNGSVNPDAPEIAIFTTTSFGSVNIYFN